MEPILILGTGALAVLFAARLGAAGTPVTLLGSWPEGLAALRRDGARLRLPDGSELAVPVDVFAWDEPCVSARLALVLVKSWKTAVAASRLANCLDADGLAVSLQNGLGNRSGLAASLGEARVALGVTTSGATLLAPGLVRPGGDGPVWLEAGPRLGPLESALGAAGFDVHVVANADSLVWGKLVVSAALNPLTALLRVPNGELLRRPAARRRMAELAGEAAAVASALGIRLPYDDPARAAEEVAERTAENFSSMLQDVLRGAPTEIDAICGEIVQAGEELHLPVPVNRMLLLMVKAIGERR